MGTLHMPEITPFKAYYFNVNNKSELESLIAPPHDVISPAERSRFLQHHDNIVQIILPDSFSKASQTLNTWIKNKRLVRRNSPAFYIYETKYLYNNQKKKRYGFLALVRLSEFSKKEIIPHERTFEKVTEGRLNLFRETNANFNPIFFIFNGDSTYTRIIQKSITRPSFLQVQDRDGVEHTIWVIEDPQDILELQTFFKTIPLIIADGHHRYSSALAHSCENGSKYTMGLLVDMNDPNLKIFPTHRLIKHVPALSANQILDKLKQYFLLEIIDFSQTNLKEKLNEVFTRLSAKSSKSFGILLYNISKFFIITLKDEFSPESLIQGTFSDAWKRLDVSILHEYVFKQLLGVSQYINDSDNIMYIKNLEDAIEAVQQGLYQLLFILNPTKAEQILKITAGSEIMPHKSTYFYPKPLSGLLIYKWDFNEKESY